MKVVLGNERFISAEGFQQPTYFGFRNPPNLEQHLIWNFSMLSRDRDFKPVLENGIILSGGNSKLNGFETLIKNISRRHFSPKEPMNVLLLEGACFFSIFHNHIILSSNFLLSL